MIYLDHNSTTKIDDSLFESVFINKFREALNPSSVHIHGKIAKSMLEESRNCIRKALNIQDDTLIIFTGSGTEANNIVINTAKINNWNIITSSIEHASILDLAKNINANILIVNKLGLIDEDYLNEILKKISSQSSNKILVSIIHSHNEIGVVQKINSICKIARNFESIVHIDAAQSIGKIEVDFKLLDVDIMTISAHKFGAFQGVGVLIVKNNIKMHPLIDGGKQEYGIRSGTHNMLGICSVGEVIKRIKSRITNMQNDINKLKEYLELEIRKSSENVIFFSPSTNSDVECLPNTLCFGLKGVSREIQVAHFSNYKISISAGSACSSGSISKPYVQKAMGYSDEDSATAIRVSLGIDNTLYEIKEFLNVWKKILNQFQILNFK